MRISDWSSDVCSSDLNRPPAFLAGHRRLHGQFLERRARRQAEPQRALLALVPADALADDVGKRSEEHTSELQSLMRISYAVFCLKKKNNKRLRTQLNTRHSCQTTITDFHYTKQTD